MPRPQSLQELRRRLVGRSLDRDEEETASRREAGDELHGKTLCRLLAQARRESLVPAQGALWGLADPERLGGRPIALKAAFSLPKDQDGIEQIANVRRERLDPAHVRRRRSALTPGISPGPNPGRGEIDWLLARRYDRLTALAPERPR